MERVLDVHLLKAECEQEGKIQGFRGNGLSVELRYLTSNRADSE